MRVLEPGQRYDPAQLCRDLTDAGYTRCDQVEGPGQFALLGGILDVFSPEGEQPVRCDFFDDEIDALGRFDPGTQRRTENIPRAVLLPAATSARQTRSCLENYLKLENVWLLSNEFQHSIFFQTQYYVKWPKRSRVIWMN